MCWFTFQTFENIGMTLGIMPVTGVPLPFVSYGGSSMFANWIAIGLLQNVHLRRARLTSRPGLPWAGASATPPTHGGPFPMPVESLFARLEPLLPQVQKPIQYVGGELNSTVKDWDACDVRWALMYPDAYEVGLPNQGVMILYEVLNEQTACWPSAPTPCGPTSRR